jgi:diguanylate cyclase (GGDEF)-like protein
VINSRRSIAASGTRQLSLFGTVVIGALILLGSALSATFVAYLSSNRGVSDLRLLSQTAPAAVGATINERLAAAEIRDQANFTWIMMVAGIAALGAGGLVLMIGRSIRRPMTALRGGVDEFAKGNLSHRVPRTRGDEFGEVVEMFNSMAWALQGNQEDLTHQALHDALTGLPNRVLFANRVAHSVAQQQREHRPIAVMFIDLDDFKVVNDSLGHAAGDELLKNAAQRLQAALRPADTAARLGGDEFAILLENVKGEAEVTAVAKRIVESLKTRFVVEGREVVVNGSVGIAISHGEVETDELLRNADMAMYAAKAQGKGRFEVFNGTMQHGVLERLELKTDLQRAVENDEFVLHYQPIIDLTSGDLIGMEALVRWDHPDRGLLPPDAFIGLSEDTGLILPLGEWVLREACQQLRMWQTQGHPNLQMSVNLSPKQLQEPGLYRQVARILEETPMNPASLILEITEGVLMEDTRATIHNLQELRKIGIRLAIDDFGTGYSSLSYLKEFPVEMIKIDRRFTQGMDRGPEESALARAIVKLSQALNMRCIAEGIETGGQIDQLKVIGCEMGQGFEFCRPLPARDLDVLLNRGRTQQPIHLP